MNRVSKILFIAAASAALTGTAFADDPPAGEGATGEGGDATPPATDPAPEPMAAGGMYSTATWPTALVDRPLTLGKGMLEIRGDVFINLSADRVAKPLAIAPDIYYGVSDKLTVGLVHNLGLCLTGTDGGCGKVYNDVGVDALFSLKRDAKMDLAAHVGLVAVTLDPFALAARLGVSFKYVAGKIGIYADPAIQIGLTERDGATVGGVTVGGNKETLALPIRIAFQATPKLAAFLDTGIAGIGLGPQAGAPLDGFGDAFVIPVGIGALFGVSNKLDVGGEFLLPAVAGSDLASTDFRALLLTVNYRAK